MRRRPVHRVGAWAAATAGPGSGAWCLVPRSFLWDVAIVLKATPTSTAGRNLRATGKARLGIGPARDLVLIEGTVQAETAAAGTGDAFAAKTGGGTGDTFAAKTGIGPRELDGYARSRLQALAGRGLIRGGDRVTPWARRRGAAPRQQRQAAQRDPGEDGRAPGELLRACRVAEEHRARHGADERLDVEERACHLGGHTALRVGEQGEREQRAAGRQGGGGQGRARSGRQRRDALANRRERQHTQGGAEELHRGRRDRVPAAQQPGLRDGERGRHQQRYQHQRVPGGARPAAVSAGDQADAGQRQGEAGPRHGARHGAPPHCRDECDHHRDRADQQGGVGDAGPGDPGVLQHDGAAVAERARGQHGRPERGPELVAGGREEDRGGQGEAHEREPARRQPVQGQLGQRHRGAPEQPGTDEGGEGAAVAVHASIVAPACTEFG
jgi:hypothetical protein